MAKNGLRWDDEDKGLLAKLWRAGATKQDISKRLCRTMSAIEKMASELRLPSRARQGVAVGSTKFDGAATMETSMRKQDREFIEAMLNAGYEMRQGTPTLNSSGSSR